MGLLSLFDFSPEAVPVDVSFDLQPASDSFYAIPIPTIPAERDVHVPPLPIEIVMTILDAAYFTYDAEPDRHLLRACALVCRAWSLPAQKLLFTHVVLRSHANYLSFRDALESLSPYRHVLANSVLRLQVSLDHTQPSGLSQRSFAHAVTLCPNLYELHVSVYGRIATSQEAPGISRNTSLQPTFEQPTLALLRSGPRVKSLHFSNWSDDRDALLQLLDVYCSSLQYLDIRGTAPRVSPSRASQPFPSRLTRLSVGARLPLDFAEWLLHHSADTLDTLSFEREPPSDVFHYLLDKFGHRLQSLGLPSCGQHEHAQAVSQCHSLKELKIAGSWTTPQLYRKLPCDVQHIALCVDADSSLQGLVEFVRVNRPRAVTLLVWSSGKDNPHLDSLKIACAVGAVDLSIIKNIHAFRNGVLVRR
ncbi:hypothetical protein FISHEDRAFT_71542 [Fistulina hepatica ATCC 64428]|uniref:Uncharacterized protein n=1 Tax=Fistulina hepatica ATCC 64428 TaxID=1128425 RepID=A0A0D7AI17_9AGAR|nr:hypothetical protein FISHEDRAFT_71542 [Fistulina hepatica ATCC 64428]